MTYTAYTTPGTPTVTDYLAFLQNSGFTPTVLSPASPWITVTFNWALPYVGPVMFGGDLLWCSPTPPPPTPDNQALLATEAVYNLATSYLVVVNQDLSGQTAFQDLRDRYGILGKGYGLIQSASDQGTSAGYMVPESLKNLTLQDLQNLKNPWGQWYSQFMQNYGSNLWGRS